MKIDHNFAIAFAPQVAEGTFNAALAAITTALADTDGLVLGVSGEGEADSGIEVDMEALREEAATLGGSFTRPPGRVTRRKIKLTATLPWCGNRQNAADPPADANFVPGVGFGALLGATGIVVGAWGAGVGQRGVPGAVSKCSGLAYINGQRYGLLDCVVSTATPAYTAGETPAIAFEVEVGSVEFATEDPLPTLDFGEQATVQPPIVENAGHAWGMTRGFEELEIEISNEVEDVPDSNAPTGLIPERTAREITVKGKMYKDDANALFEWEQLGEDEAGDLEALSFQIGTSAVALGPILAIGVNIPMLEITTVKETTIGGKAAVEIEGVARHTSPNSEIEFLFR